MKTIMRLLAGVWTYLVLALVLLVLLPVMALLAALARPWKPARSLASRAFRWGGGLVARSCPLWRFRVSGALPSGRRAYVVVADHRSAVDIIALCLLCRDGWDMRWLAKVELFRMPWLGWLMRLAGDVPVDREDSHSGALAYQRAASLLSQGIPVMIFPEGTRSQSGALGPFQPGAFHLAIEQGVPILPVAIRGTESCFPRGGHWPSRAEVELRILEPIETRGRVHGEVAGVANEVAERLALALHTPITAADRAPPKLDRDAISAAIASGRRLLVQGAMGIMASDGLPGKVARIRSDRFLTAGTISGVVKSIPMLGQQIERSRKEAPGGYVGINLMAAINRDDFEALARAALSMGVSFVVQGAGISREIIRWCRESHTPFAGIVSSGRLAQLYEKWGADFLVAEGREAGGHLGDPDLSLERLLREVAEASSLPVVAAGGLAEGADLGRTFAAGASGVQLATRFIVTTDCDVHPNFKLMHMNRTEADVVTITSTVKGMKARAIRNRFTERLAAGEAFPPKSKRRHFGQLGYRGRRSACIDCLGVGLCTNRESGHKESFCISDVLLAAAVDGDMENGLFYTGQSVTRIHERTLDELRSAAEIVAELEAEWSRWEAARGSGPAPLASAAC